MKTRFRRCCAGSVRSKVLAAVGAIIAIGVVGWGFFFPPNNLTDCSSPGSRVWANMRSLQIATAAMTMDNEAAGDGVVWTSVRENGKLRPATLAEFFEALTRDNGYLSKTDLRKLLSAPGFPTQPDDVPLTAENIPFRIFWVDGESPRDQLLFVTRNWQDGRVTDTEPFGKKGFIYYTMGGGGGIKRPKASGNADDFPKGRDAEGRTYRYVELR